MATAVLFTGCIVFNSPAFREAGRLEDERLRRYAEKVVSENPLMQEIDRRCRSEISTPTGFEALSFMVGSRRKFISYEYHSDADYKTIKAFFVEYFEQHGWRRISDNRLADAYDAVKYRKEDYYVAVYRFNPSQRVNYKITCERVSENTPEDIRRG